jgi:hypothetical protein
MMKDGTDGQQSENPYLIIVGGQPGAAISGTTGKLRSRFGGKPYVFFDRSYVFQPGDRPFNGAVNDRAHIIVERDQPKEVLWLANTCRLSNYTCQLNIIPTGYVQSWTRVIDKANKAQRNGLPLEAVESLRAHHDSSYEGWARVILSAEIHRCVDRIVIGGSLGVEEYNSHLTKSEDGNLVWANNDAHALEALLLGRHRALHPNDSRQIVEAWDRIERSAYMNGSPDPISVENKRLLESDREKILSFAKSNVSKIDIVDMWSYTDSVADLKHWHNNIVEDLGRLRTHDGKFDDSEVFGKRIDLYALAMTDFVNQRGSLSNSYANPKWENIPLKDTIDAIRRGSDQTVRDPRGPGDNGRLDERYRGAHQR